MHGVLDGESDEGRCMNMAAKVPTKLEIASAIETYCQKYPDLKIERSYDEPIDSWHLKDVTGVEVIIGPGFTCTDASLLAALREIIMDAREGNAVEPPRKATSQTDKAIMPFKARNAVGGPLAKPGMTVRDIQVAELTFDDIRQFLCPAASDKDTFMFLKLCQARNLNPFTGEAFLIPYKDQKTQEIKCSMVVGKEAFMRKAEANSQYRGFKAGIIVSKGDELIYREGTFTRKGETLEGGWCEVFRADRDHPIRSEVSLIEYDSNHSLWSHGKKATMIRKVSVVQSHREAFPADLAGCYDSSELGVIDPEKGVSA